MGTTPTLLFPYPAASDAADGPTQIAALATALDTYLVSIKPRYAQKSADEAVTSSTTLQNDDHLTLASIPIGTWAITGELFINGISSAAQDFKMAFTFPTGVISFSGIGLATSWVSGTGNADVQAAGVVNASSSPTSTASFGCATGANVPIHLMGHLVNTAIGTLTLQWAQDTSSASATTLKQGSWIALRPLA